MKTGVRNFHCTATKLNNDSLSSEAASEDDEEDPVVPHAAEHVQLVVDFSGVDQVEDLHYSEDVEHIRHVSAHSVLLLVLAVERGAVPILNSSGEYVGLVATEPIFDVGLGEEVLAGEDNRIDDDDFVNSHAQQVLHHLPGNDVLVSSIGWAVKQIQSGRLGGKRQRGKRVHDQVDPEQLDGL